MTNNWFDLIYYAVGSIYYVRKDMFDRMCECEDSIDAIGKDDSLESKNKKSEIVINFLKDNGVLSKEIIKNLRVWTNNVDDARTKFQDAT
jgi:hypothetical protein